MKKRSLLALLFLYLITIGLYATGIVKYYFDPSTGIFKNRKKTVLPINKDYFLLPNEIINNKVDYTIVKIQPQKWFGITSRTIKALAENQGKINFLIGFRNNITGECLRVVCHFEQWPGLCNLPSCFSQEVKGVMFLPFVPTEPNVGFVSLNSRTKLPYLYSKSWEVLPKYHSVAFPCYVLFERQRLVFGMSPRGPFFTINLEGKKAVFQRKYTRALEMNNSFSYTLGSMGLTKAFKLDAFNVNVCK